jgi:hypothetical protein
MGGFLATRAPLSPAVGGAQPWVSDDTLAVGRDHQHWNGPTRWLSDMFREPKKERRGKQVIDLVSSVDRSSRHRMQDDNDNLFFTRY